MRITYLGNFKHSFCTETHLALTMEQLGHDVIRIQEDEATLHDVVDRANMSDLFFWTRTYGMMQFDGYEMLREIKVPTVSYHLDYYFGISRELQMNRDPFWSTDYVFQPDGDHQKEFKAMGINSYWLPPGVFEDECSLEDLPKTRDLVFVGSWQEYHGEWPWRRELVNNMFSRYPQFEVFPNSGPMRGKDLNELYQSTKVVIGDSLNLDGNKTYTSDRIFETTGRGGFIVYPDVRWLTEIFPQEIFYKSRDFQSVIDKVDYFLAHEDEKEDLRRTCHNITLKEHTYTNRLEEVFRIIK